MTRTDDPLRSIAPPAVPVSDLPFQTLADALRVHARERPDAPAITAAGTTLGWAALDALVDRIAASLQRDGCAPGDAVAICAWPSVRYAAVFLGALRAGLVVAPLAPSVTAEALRSMRADAGARLLFADVAARGLLDEADPAAAPPPDRVAAEGAAVAAPPSSAATPTSRTIALDDTLPGLPFDDWLLPEGHAPTPVTIDAEAPFNVIYSSGTTGLPKGIVQSHGMRWTHVVRGGRYGYGPDGVTVLATPLYSNTTLVVFFPTLAFGGHVVLMPKFDARAYLELAERVRMTHTMLVPVQYQRVMSVPDFDRHDLGATRFKFCTSAPFHAALKADVLRRWPGGLVEFYGMTEGGGTCILEARLRPDKLHTVGAPAEGHDLRLIDEDGRELPPGSTGEVVGHSPGMMTGYHRQPARTREAEWFDATGKRFIRTGDVGRFDTDGFLVLMDRRKDMLISGGFNIYPSDLEAVAREHPAVEDVAVVGVPSSTWGETPIALVVRRGGDTTDASALLEWINARLGKTQRLARLDLVEDLPRSAIGKVLKRELRDRHVASGADPR